MSKITYLGINETGKAGKPVISLGKGKPKAYGAVQFLPLVRSAFIDGKATKFDEIVFGQHFPTSFPILYDAKPYCAGTDAKKDPRKDTRKEQPANHASVCFDLASLPDDMRSAMEVIESDFKRIVAVAKEQKLWTARSEPDEGCHIRRTYTDQATDTEKRGQPRQSPLLSMRVEFDNFPGDYFMTKYAGKPRSAIYEWTSRTVDEKGVERFELRKDAAGNPINAANSSSILKAGDIVRRLSVAVDTLTITKDGFHLRMCVREIWVETPPDTGLPTMSQAEQELIAQMKAASLAKATSDKPVVAAAAAPAQLAKPREETSDEDAGDGDDADEDD